MTRYLLDTDAVIDIYKGFPSTVDLVENLYHNGDALCTCNVIVAEVCAGLYPTERERGTRFLQAMQFLPTSITAAFHAGIWRHDFARRRRQLATTDCLIAATAYVHGAILITGNVDDYPMQEVARLPLPRQSKRSQ